MQKKIWIYLALGLAAALALAGIVWYFTRPAAKPPASGHGNLPSYFLDPAEAQRVERFVKNFVSLYNTYSQGDFSNLYAVGSYETAAQQTRTLAYIKQLEAQTPAGYEVRTVADSGKFSYTYPSADSLLAQVTANVSQSTGTETKLYSITAQLVLRPDGKNWRIDQISTIK